MECMSPAPCHCVYEHLAAKAAVEHVIRVAKEPELYAAYATSPPLRRGGYSGRTLKTMASNLCAAGTHQMLNGPFPGIEMPVPENAAACNRMQLVKEGTG